MFKVMPSHMPYSGLGMSPRDLRLTASDETEGPELSYPLAKGLCSPIGSCRPVHPVVPSTRQYIGSCSPHRCDMLCSHANHRAASQTVASDKRRGIPNTFIHYKGENSHVKGVTVQLSLHAPLQPRAFSRQQYNQTYAGKN
jgi:hypothetical protein